MEETSFMETSFKNVIFDKCNLKNSDFYSTSLSNVDLSTSNIDGIRVDVKNLCEALINFEQATIVANMLGINVE